uniref:Uncharacterized protein n=1 Tax=Amphimedon queenslandica TaxID=400682 RepID=A0A1X7T0K2_AMPQE
DSRSWALLLSISIPHAGDWLNALPSPNDELHLLDSEFRLCLKYWLRIPHTSGTASCPFCTFPADPVGNHTLACGGNGDRTHRHNGLRDVFSAAQSAALSHRREAPSLTQDSVSPADVFLPSWSQGRPAVLDVTVTSPLQRLTLSNAASSQGSTLLKAEHRKRVLHHDDCTRAGISYVPMAVETLGGWSPIGHQGH